MKALSRCAFLFLLLTLVIPAAAQDELTQTVDLPDGYVITVPDDWELEAGPDTGGVYLKNSDYTVFILTPPQVSKITAPGDSLSADMLVDISATLFDRELDADSIEEIQIGDRAASRAYYVLRADVGVVYMIEIADESFAFVDAIARAGKTDELEDALTLVMATLRPADEAARSAQPCLVSTETRDTARLRVGPGTNRSSVAFLPVGDTFEVQGRFEDTEGGIWYQLDKAAAAPQSAASEIWVAQTDVTETGGCDAVVDASAPPIVPITSNPPPGAGNTNTGAAGTIPNGGAWLVSFNSEADASCQGTGNLHFKTNEVLAVTSFAAVISISGDSMIFDGVPFTRTAPGAYFGSINMGSTNSQIRLNVVNANLITGSMIVNGSINGVACSVTVGLTITR